MKLKQMKTKKNENAITLIALVVTIVVLLILASVSISMLTGESGIISQASRAKMRNNHATVSENLKLKVTDEYATNIGDVTSDQILEYLKGKGYIDENAIVNVKETTGETLSTGNGTNGKDVYFIKDGELYYADSEGVEEKLDFLFNKTIYPEEEYFDFDPSTGTIRLKDAGLYYTSVYNKDFPITDIVVPSTYKGQKVERIGVMAYRNIKSVIIPEGVKYISPDAFNGNANLQTIVIPKSIVSIGSYAFCYYYHRNSTLIVNYAGNETEWNNIQLESGQIGGPSYIERESNIIYNYSE